MQTTTVVAAQKKTDRAIVANTIKDQIGESALFMLGARDLMVVDGGLSFRIRGSRAVQAICVILGPCDTYTVSFLAIRSGNVRQVAVESGVYVDSLGHIIEKNTGLYLSL